MTHSTPPMPPLDVRDRLKAYFDTIKQQAAARENASARESLRNAVNDLRNWREGRELP